MTMTVAVLGLGAMGTRMAQRLLGAGFEVRVFNRTATRCEPLVSAGATAHRTPADAARGADVVLSMVRDDQASERVWLEPDTGALQGMDTHAVAVECSTLSPAWVARLGAAASQRGVALVDAPVVGSRPQAEAGALVVLAGGAETSISTIEPVLAAVAGAVHHLGPVGRGCAMKLAVNALFGVQVAAVAELLAALRSAGIQPSDAMDVLGALAVCSPAAKGVGGLMVAERYAPQFPVELVDKDLGYALSLVPPGGAPVVDATRGVFARATQAGLGHENLVAVAKLYR